MAGKEDLCALLHEILDGGHGSADTGVVSDVEVGIERDVEVSTDKHPLALEISLSQITHALLGHGDDAAAGSTSLGDMGGDGGVDVVLHREDVGERLVGGGQAVECTESSGRLDRGGLDSLAGGDGLRTSHNLGGREGAGGHGCGCREEGQEEANWSNARC